MDKITKYQQIILEVLKRYASIKKNLTPLIKSHLIIDKENHHYQLLSMGWQKNQHVFTVAFHVEIIGEKVWIQQNNTDVMIADELCESGILKSDIVLGFIPEKVREATGFAVE
ncbi:MAG: XisI protein [Microscillaceae bacterium]|nr:XisI protein [Microscillaceae bacterium]